jgi:sugar (pentulose or hexulose) kinase
MRDAVVELTGAPPARIVATGAPVGRNDRLAALMAALAGSPLPVVDLDAPVAAGAAALAAEREGLTAHCEAPVRTVPAAHLAAPVLRARFARALAESSADSAPRAAASIPEGAS